MSNVKRIINVFFGELMGRSGFDDWWYSIEQDIRDEIDDIIYKGVDRELAKALTERNRIMREALERLLIAWDEDVVSCDAGGFWWICLEKVQNVLKDNRPSENTPEKPPSEGESR